jgi:hypothetical protein
MSTLAPTAILPSRSNPFGFFGLLFLVAVAAGLALSAHATLHTSASTVANCDSRNLGAVLLNTATGRRTMCVEVNPGEFGRIVIDQNQEDVITSYLNSEARKNTLTKVIGNLYRQGYRSIEWVRADLADKIAEILAGLP